MRDIGAAIEFLHNLNIAHRDIKVSTEPPSNPETLAPTPTLSWKPNPNAETLTPTPTPTLNPNPDPKPFLKQAPWRADIRPPGVGVISHNG